MDHSQGWEAVGARASAAVRTSGLPIAEIARRAGISDKYIYALMNGTPRKYGAGAVRFGRVFNLPASWLEDTLAGRWAPSATQPIDDDAALRDRVGRLERGLIGLLERLGIDEEDLFGGSPPQAGGD